MTSSIVRTNMKLILCLNIFLLFAYSQGIDVSKSYISGKDLAREDLLLLNVSKLILRYDRDTDGSGGGDVPIEVLKNESMERMEARPTDVEEKPNREKLEVAQHVADDADMMVNVEGEKQLPKEDPIDDNVEGSGDVPEDKQEEGEKSVAVEDLFARDLPERLLPVEEISTAAPEKKLGDDNSQDNSLRTGMEEESTEKVTIETDDGSGDVEAPVEVMKSEESATPAAETEKTPTPEPGENEIKSEEESDVDSATEQTQEETTQVTQTTASDVVPIPEVIPSSTTSSSTTPEVTEISEAPEVSSTSETTLELTPEAVTEAITTPETTPLSSSTSTPTPLPDLEEPEESETVPITTDTTLTSDVPEVTENTTISFNVSDVEEMENETSTPPENIEENKGNPTLHLSSVVGTKFVDANDNVLLASKEPKRLGAYIVIGLILLSFLSLIGYVALRKQIKKRRKEIESNQESRDTEKALLSLSEYKDHPETEENNIKNNELTPIVIKQNSQINKFEKNTNFSSPKNLNTTPNEKNVEKDNVLKSTSDSLTQVIIEDSSKNTDEEKVVPNTEKLIVRTHLDQDSIPKKAILINRTSGGYLPVSQENIHL